MVPPKRASIISGPRGPLALAAALLVAITLGHYLTPPHDMAAHNIFRRLYYLPIVVAAFAGGLRAGLLSAAISVLAYAPHAFFLEHQHDPAPFVDKALEIVLYLGVGGLAGGLVDRERRARARQVEEMLGRREAEDRADRLQGLIHLTRGLAHEIRNPLGGIQGAIEILADAHAADPRMQEMAEIGLKETERLNRVLTDFLSFARPREPKLEPMDAAPLVRHVATLCATEAARAGALVRAHLPDDPLGALGDSEQLSQVLINLTRNALQAAGKGGRVILSAEAREGRVIFTVTDDGPGVPEELGESIYDPYVTGREEGTGLGLSTSALIVRAYGGVLSHARTEEATTVFRFDLPAA